MKTAAAFQVGVCGDPTCTALHLISCDECGEPLVNTPITAASIPPLIEAMQDHLYAVAALKGTG